MHRTFAVLAATWACACGPGAAAPARPITPAEPETPAGERALAPSRSVAVSGGTLLVSRDGRAAIVADPDRDRVFVVDLVALTTRFDVALRHGDEPGRVVEDGLGRVHVALRRGGAIATLDPSSGAILLRRGACRAPRGLAYDEVEDALWVACADGALVTFGVMDARPRRVRWLPPDLRDVIVRGDLVQVSRFRSAEILTLDRGGRVVHARRPRPLDLDDLEDVPVVDRPRRRFEPRVAWRMVESPRGELWMVHHRNADFPVDLQVAEASPRALPYGGVSSPRLARCPPGILHSAITRFGGGRRALEGSILPGALPVDLAFSPSGDRVALAFAGERSRNVGVISTSVVEREPCAEQGGSLSAPGALSAVVNERAVAVAWVDESRLAVQYAWPPALAVFAPPLLSSAREVRLGEIGSRHGGHEVFHDRQPAGMACASCHPEGEDDGHVWQLGALGGTRRTQTLGGGVLAGPLHWSGDVASLDALMDEVLVERMGGARPLPGDVAALASYLDALPAPTPATLRDPHAVERGRAIFEERGCAGCHRGPRFSDERNHDVGTGEPLQTPTLLGLASRAPYFHDGRARTLRERFGRGHTEGHGELGGIDDAGITDLVAYLSSL